MFLMLFKEVLVVLYMVGGPSYQGLDDLCQLFSCFISGRSPAGDYGSQRNTSFLYLGEPHNTRGILPLWGITFYRCCCSFHPLILWSQQIDQFFLVLVCLGLPPVICRCSVSIDLPTSLYNLLCPVPPWTPLYQWSG